MLRRPSLAFALTFSALASVASAGFAQDARLDPPEGAEEAPAPAAPAAEEVDTRVDLKGNRFSVTLKNGNILVGVMPNGLVWEKPDELGIYTVAKDSDAGVGIRLYYVLNMDGDLFISRGDIGLDDRRKLQVRDLGELTEAQKAEIRERILSDRRKVIEDRETRINEELARITAEEEKAKEGEEDAEGEGDAEKKPDKEADEAAEDARRGDELLARFPDPDWSEKRLKEILRREVVNHIFRNDEERDFIDGFKLWKAALERKQAAEKGKTKEPVKEPVKETGGK